MRLIQRKQRGFTLIELIVALAITGFITGGITTTIFQVITIEARTSNHMTAVRQVQNAGFQVSHDGQMAQRMLLASDPYGFPLYLKWTKWDGEVNEVTYNVTVVNNELRRSHSINGGVASETTVAIFINSDPNLTKCELGGDFTLPDIGDAFTITGGNVADNGIITVAAGSISVTTTGTATYNAYTGDWTTLAAGDNVVVVANEVNTEGVWTSTSASAMAVITEDSNNDVTVTGGKLTFTVTATVGGGRQEASETRTYEVIPRPGI